MRREFILVIIASALESRTAHAEPPPLVQPSPHHEVTARLTLTPEEQELLREGDVSGASHVGGIIAAATIGLGTGQLVQGRWLKRGWIFTVGEMVSVAAFGIAASENDLDPTLVNVLGFSGVIGLIGFHAWEIADAAIVPARHNRRVRFLRARVGLPTLSLEVRRVREAGNDRGALVGVRIRF